MSELAQAITTSATYQAIIRQPAEVRRMAQDEQAWQVADEAATLLAQARHVFLVGTGTSHHAAQIGQFLLRAVGADAWAVTAFDFALYPQPLTVEDAVVIISHRGTKHFSRQSLEKARLAGARLIAITGQGSPLAESGALAVPTTAQDPSSTHTISYMTALAALLQIASCLAEKQGQTDSSARLRGGLVAIADALDAAIAQQTKIADALRQMAVVGARLFFTGPGPSGVTAMEGALKCKEAAYVTAEGAALETFLHGPIVSLEPGDHVVFLNTFPTGTGAERVAAVARAVERIGAGVWLVGQPPRALGRAAWIALAAPANDEICANLAQVVPLQLLACFLAGIRGTNPDSFRRDVPAYKAALEAITL